MGVTDYQFFSNALLIDTNRYAPGGASRGRIPAMARAFSPRRRLGSARVYSRALGISSRKMAVALSTLKDHVIPA